MEYRELGESGLSASAITFGAWAIGGWMWGGAERKDAVEAIRASYDHGVTSIDTAPIYGQGLSEEIVGEALKGISRDKVQIMTKYGMRWDEQKGEFGFRSQDNEGRPLEVYKYAGKDSIVKECEDSLRRLRTDHIDLYQIHWPDSTTPVEETMEAVGQLLKQGKIRAAGVSNYNAELMSRAEETLHLASDQVPFSMVNRDIEKELMPLCAREGVGILPYFPLASGFLTGKYRTNADKTKSVRGSGAVKHLDGKGKPVLAALDAVAARHGATCAQVALAWVMAKPAIAAPIASATSVAQVTELMGALELKLTAADVAELDKASA